MKNNYIVVIDILNSQRKSSKQFLSMGSGEVVNCFLSDCDVVVS